MIEVTYTCDKCKATFKTNDQFWEVGIIRNCLSLSSRNNYPILQAQWCRPCMEKAGLLGGENHPESQVPPVAPPTLEDIIRDIVRMEIESIGGSHG